MIYTVHLKFLNKSSLTEIHSKNQKLSTNRERLFQMNHQEHWGEINGEAEPSQLSFSVMTKPVVLIYHNVHILIG